jgi:photosystem II stability/assembly factor-like uncharacterized protein
MVLLLSAWLIPSPAQAESEALEWTKIDKPGDIGNLVVTPSEVSEIAIGSDGVFYVADSENSKFYRSLDAGVTWEDITSYLVKAGAELPAGKAIKIAVAPDKPGIVAVVTSDGIKVYLSTDGGIDWTDTSVPGLVSTIQAIAISTEYTIGEKSYREIAIGTADWGDVAGTTTGQVWVRRSGGYPVLWVNQELTIDPDPSDLDPSHLGGEVSALAYSPDFQNDYTLLVVASTNSDYGTATYQNKTWLCLLERDTGTWNTPVAIVSAGDASDVSWIHTSLALPTNYSGSNAATRRLFVSYDLNLKPANPVDPDLDDLDADDDVYWLSDTAVTRLNANIANPGNPINICSLAYSGTTTKGTLLAGDVDRVTGSLTVQVRRTEEPFAASPAWYLSTVPPTGPGNAKVAWSSDGEMAYCGTSKPSGVIVTEPDESAFSASLVGGDRWRQMGLIDTIIKIADVVPAPDGESLFITTYNEYGPEGIWRSAGDPLGERWERVLTMDSCCDGIILRLSLNYDDDSTLYAAEADGSQLAVSYNRGNTWKWCRFPPAGCPGGPIIDLVVAAEDTVYAALPEGYVAKTTSSGSTWWDLIDTDLPDINMLAIVDAETIFVGGRKGDIAYSTDGGESFTLIDEIIASGLGDVQVVADTNYQENGTIYAATNLPDKGIWRWVIGISTEWEQIDESITELEKGQCIGGLVVGPEGTLYALRIEPASNTSGGMTRSLNPLETDPDDIEFDLVNDDLPTTTTFDPNLVYSHTLPYLKLSGNAEQNELWTINTTNQIIYRYQDTLCKVRPTLISPDTGDIIPIDSTGYITDFIMCWEELEGAEEYEVAIYSDSEATKNVWSHTTTTLVNATSASEPAQLTRGTEYYWRVRAVEPIKSPWSETRSFAASLAAAQWSPLTGSTGISPSSGDTNVPIKPAFAWKSADGATGYEFVLARDSEFTDVVIAMTGADAVKITAWGCDRNLDYSTTYFWKVRAISAVSYSEWGVSIFTTEAAPSAVSQPQTSITTSPTLITTSSIPSYMIGIAIGTGVVLVVSLLVFIVRTGRKF